MPSLLKDARARAEQETDPQRRSAWLQAAAEVDALGEEKTVGDLPQARSGMFYNSTGAVYAYVTPELLLESMKDPDLTKAREQRVKDN